MSIVMDFLQNYVLVCALSSWAVAQVWKFILNYIIDRKVNFERLSGAGGMPSAHSATVTALTIACARFCGTGSTEFAIAVVVAAVVIYDAMGVRHEAGEHAKIINQMLKKSSEEDDDSDDPEIKELKEMLGHTPLEVVGGVLLGILVPLVIPMR
ncbi:MAG: divergent PAP2 family protein [Firmicutes bacterium]|nr:divergent PAP2 family protein [Bacillota bacterium]